MVEKLQAGSEKQPEAHLNDVNGAIAAAKKENPAAAALAGPDGGGSGGSSRTEDPVIDGLITAPVKALSVATALADGLTGGNSGQSGPKNQTSNIGGVAGSQFVGGSTRAPTPLVPMGYREMVEAAKRARRLAAKLKDKGKDGVKHLSSNVFGRVETAGLSLSGGSLSESSGGADGQKRNGVPIKGLVVSAAAAAGVAIITKLYKERATTLNVMDGDNRYRNNPLLLAEDMKKGSQRAKQALKKAPAIKHSTAST